MNEDLINKWWDSAKAWRTGEVSLLDPLYDPTAVFHVFPFGDMDLEAQKQFTFAFSQAFPDFTLNRLEDIIHGDTTVHRWSCSGTFTGKSPMMPVEPTGKQTYAEGTHILHWKDGKVIETFHYGDWLGWLIGCGVLPPLAVPG